MVVHDKIENDNLHLNIVSLHPLCGQQIWNTRDEDCVTTLEVKANACSVRFNPWDPNQVTPMRHRPVGLSPQYDDNDFTQPPPGSPYPLHNLLNARCLFPRLQWAQRPTW